MIKSIKIENFKSIQSLELDLGRLNIFIGANGSGKSNILEAIAMGSAAMEDKLDDEFLTSRGIRTTEPKFMKSGFEKTSHDSPISIKWESEKTNLIELELINSNSHYNNWQLEGKLSSILSKIKENWNVEKKKLKKEEILSRLKKEAKNIEELNILSEKQWNVIAELHLAGYLDESFAHNLIKSVIAKNDIFYDFVDFIIYTPENHFLRRFEEEGALKPLGIKGEGLFKLITIIAAEKPEQFQKIKEHLKLIDWFEDFEIPGDLKFTEKRIKIKDAYLDEDLQYFDQRSANEGFLYLLFYLTLFISDETPHFFSIDNIDNALNPKLGSELIKILSQLSKDHNKQALLTTHNPVILDGLDLTDDDQRLFVVYRNADGHTKVRRIPPQKSPNGTKPVRLSEAFIRGYIGGLPKNF